MLLLCRGQVDPMLEVQSLSCNVAQRKKACIESSPARSASPSCSSIFRATLARRKTSAPSPSAMNKSKSLPIARNHVPHALRISQHLTYSCPEYRVSSIANPCAVLGSRSSSSDTAGRCLLTGSGMCSGEIDILPGCCILVHSLVKGKSQRHGMQIG